MLEIVPISYSKAEDLVGQLSSFLSGRGSITTDKRTNSLIVKDIEENINKIKELVAELDIPTPQVRIEARIVNDAVAQSTSRSAKSACVCP